MQILYIMLFALVVVTASLAFTYFAFRSSGLIKAAILLFAAGIFVSGFMVIINMLMSIGASWLLANLSVLPSSMFCGFMVARIEHRVKTAAMMQSLN